MRACSILTVLVCKQLYIHKDFSLGAEERMAEHEGWCGISDVRITNEHKRSVMDMKGGRAGERHSQHVYGSTRLDRASSVCKQMWYLSKSAALGRAVCHSGRRAKGIIFTVRQALKGRHTLLTCTIPSILKISIRYPSFFTQGCVCLGLDTDPQVTSVNGVLMACPGCQ